jgi:hypothetical protein
MGARIKDYIEIKEFYSEGFNHKEEQSEHEPHHEDCMVHQQADVVVFLASLV